MLLHCVFDVSTPSQKGIAALVSSVPVMFRLVCGARSSEIGYARSQNGMLDEVKNWYTTTFNLALSDTLFKPGTEQHVMHFLHIDKGEEYVDHHVSV